MDMKRAPDQVTYDLRRHEAQQRAAEIEYEMNLPARKDQAMEDIKDPNALRGLLNDQELSGPLARAMHNLEYAVDELGKAHLRDNESIGLRACIQSLCQIERVLFGYAMEAE